MEAERRQVTILFTDMVGFTAFSERYGEEAAFRLMQSLAKLMDEAVHDQGGVVQGFTGDGVMAVFGAPVAFEDAPLRACRAALAILQRLQSAGAEFVAKHEVRPELRIGINSGPAVVGKVQSGADAGVTVLGDTVNVAARLQSLAAPGSAVLSEATRRLVEGRVDSVFVGKHQFKGKAEPQKVYQLEAIRQGATRFAAAIDRGLSAYVGRESELEMLELGLADARGGLRVIDIVAEPGLGKSRLLHEFRHRISNDGVFVLSGSCSSDGQHTPYLPFVEMVRGSFRVSAGEAEDDVARKLEAGLTGLGLASVENLSLLLNLLGLTAPAGALSGLDGVLIGQRTRDLLLALLEARCRLSAVVMLIEDLHWVDSVSAEVLGKIVASEAAQRLLLLHTRRPEYAPAWLDRPIVTKLALAPLPAVDIRRLVQARLGVASLPEALGKLVSDKAEGNALFAEEIVSFLAERGALRAEGDGLVFDALAVAAGLPASLQSLLTARVDRLAPEDRALLQAASVIGRRFDPALLAVAAGEPDGVENRLAAMCAADLLAGESASGELSFKHALVRDALYQSLLTGPRVALHLKIAQEIERRGANRLAEVAEALALHYGQTELVDKAFIYLAMAAAKSLGVYSLDEAETHFSRAVALIDRNPDCASDQQVADFLVDYAMFLNFQMEFTTMVAAAEKYMPSLDRLGDNAQTILVLHQYFTSLIQLCRFRDAEAVQAKISPMAERLGEDKPRAYSLAGLIFSAAVLAPNSLAAFETLSAEAIAIASRTNDAFIQGWIRWAIGWHEIICGRIARARELAQELMKVGRELRDPRSTGFGLTMLTWIAIISDNYDAGLMNSEEAKRVALTRFDRVSAMNGIAVSMVLLRRPEGVAALRDVRSQCAANDWRYSGTTDGAWGVGLVLGGKIREGIRFIEKSIAAWQHEDNWPNAMWNRSLLSELYLEMIAGKEKAPVAVMVRNLPILIEVMLFGGARIIALIAEIKQYPGFDPNGYHIGRCEMILGLLYKSKKKRALALQHLSEARRIVSQLGRSPVLERIDGALAELG